MEFVNISGWGGLVWCCDDGDGEGLVGREWRDRVR